MGALDGIVVLDFGRRYPPSYTAMFLADFGADVIKIDPPANKRTDISELPEDRVAAHYPPDRNKRSIILDLKSETGREVLCRLVERADVLVEGFRPGVMEKLGVGYSRLREINPRLIYCAMSGFGQTGPYINLSGHDMNYIALGGALSLIGERNGQPYLPSNMIADFGGAGMHGVVGILLALAARQNTGRGQFVDISYLDSVISLNAGAGFQYFVGGKVPKRGETMTTGGQPWAQVFRCKDGEYFTIAPMEAHLWANLCRALGREDLTPHQHTATLEETDRVRAEMAAIFLTRTRDEWWDYLKDKDCCVAPVLNVDETFRDAQVLHRQMVVEMPHPKFGTVRQMGIPIKLSDTPGEIRRVGAPLGTHNVEVLSELGYSQEEIGSLRSQGVLG